MPNIGNLTSREVVQVFGVPTFWASPIAQWPPVGRQQDQQPTFKQRLIVPRFVS